MKPTVYVIQRNNKKSFDKAERFGNLRYIADGAIFPDNHDEKIIEVTRRARTILREFNPETDHILLVGCPVIMASVIRVLTEYTDSFNALKWDNIMDDYFLVEVRG